MVNLNVHFEKLKSALSFILRFWNFPNPADRSGRQKRRTSPKKLVCTFSIDHKMCFIFREQFSAKRFQFQFEFVCRNVRLCVVKSFQTNQTMILPFVLVTVASLLFVAYKLKGSNNKDGKKKPGNFWILMKAIFNFLFRVKSEDRLNSLKQIHKFFPRYTRIKFFNYDNIIIYDPELCKKVFSAQSACQRPFRNCFQLEYGLLSSECKHPICFHGRSNLLI